MRQPVVISCAVLAVASLQTPRILLRVTAIIIVVNAAAATASVIREVLRVGYGGC